MKYNITGGGQVVLSKKDFVGSGGEGSVYVKGGTAFKIYSKPERMIPEKKIYELSGISDQNVIRPIDILKHNGGKPVGYTMRFVKDGIPICKFFTKSFRKRNGIGIDNIVDIVGNARNGLKNIHIAGVLVVDLNELNLLVNGSDVYWIDVDSYQTKNYPATAIMDSIRDRHAKAWSEGSDWFSWGIITFQLFTGIHPYKGKHPSVGKMDDRMIQNISVFDKDVSVPKAVENFNEIPESYRNWYRAVFDDGKRIPPPSDVCGTVVIHPRQISSTKKIDIREFFVFDEDVTGYFSARGIDFVFGETRIARNEGCRKNVVNVSNARLLMGESGNEYYCCFNMGCLSIFDSKSVLVKKFDNVKSIIGYEGRVYAHFYGQDFLSEISVIGKNFVTSIVANIMPNSTTLFDGVAIQNMIGTWYASVFPTTHACYQARLKDLDEYKIIDAKYDKRVLIVVGVKDGKYDKFVYRFKHDYSDIVLFWVDRDVNYTGINFVTLDKGICVHIDESEELVLFASDCRVDSIKRVSDSVIGGDMRLFKKGDDVLFGKDMKLFKISMK